MIFIHDTGFNSPTRLLQQNNSYHAVVEMLIELLSVDECAGTDRAMSRRVFRPAQRLPCRCRKQSTLALAECGNLFNTMNGD